jgi:hypothetical protein
VSEEDALTAREVTMTPEAAGGRAERGVAGKRNDPQEPGVLKLRSRATMLKALPLVGSPPLVGLVGSPPLVGLVGSPPLVGSPREETCWRCTGVRELCRGTRCRAT